MLRRIPFILACLSLIIIFAVFTNFISDWVIKSGVNEIELQSAEDDLLQVRSYLKLSELRMHQHLVDWACWDEAYSFMDTHDPKFIANNFDHLLLEELHIAAAAFYDLEGHLITFVDGIPKFKNQIFKDAEEQIFKKLAKNLLQKEELSFQGLVNVQGEGLVIATHKVLDGNKFKAPKGVLVMSKLIDQDFLAEAKKIARLDFKILPVESFHSLANPQKRGEDCQIVTSSELIHVYGLAYDCFGQAAFCLDVRAKRIIAALGRQIAQKNFWLILGLAIFILLVGVMLLLHVQRKFMQREIAYRANHDNLTDLPTKGLFSNRLNEFLEQNRSSPLNIGVMLIDLDHFKGVNDLFGHRQGDKILHETASRLKSIPNSKVARYGGDEFLLALKAKDENFLESQALKIRDLLCQPFELAGNRIHLGASIGMATFPKDGWEAELLIHRAELAMYEAKAKGRNIIAHFESKLDVEASRKMELETALYKALEDQVLQVHFQPKVDVKAKDVVGCEALVRWQISDKEWIAPPVFIPLAEEIGLIKEIDMYVLRRACRQIKSWKQEGSGVVPVAVNMSARSILAEGFTSQVLQILAEEDTPPNLIELEITESCLMTELDEAFNVIYSLHNAGINIALDDFGTGYSSIQYLSAMPISCLKIDKKFIDDIFSGKSTGQLLI
ncbi:MAG: EAL domain-containing protein, partial [Desulfovibrionaceae bacterium]|nr:EAL domain-containing protein [Desulfovibrionaceae bacterium]